MTTEQLYILALLRKSFGLDEELNKVDNLEDVKNMILRNGILTMVYGLLPVELQRSLHSVYYSTVRQGVIQEHEGKRILGALNSAEMDCIALKGWEMRKMYPLPSMRQMADLDFLIRNYRFESIKAVMKQLGYVSDGETSWKHDNFKKHEVCVEMHKRLSDDSDVVQQWEKSIWENALPTEFKHVFVMAPKDLCIFHFVHLHKDFLNGSLGLRRIVDTWLLHEMIVSCDEIKTQLQQMGLWTFSEKMIRLSRIVFGEEEMNHDAEILLEHAFLHGIYGTDKSAKAGRVVLMSNSLAMGKVSAVLAAIFLPYRKMKAYYPILGKWTILLPIYWIKRDFELMKRGIHKNLNGLDYTGVSKKDWIEMKKVFEAGGIAKKE